MNGDVAILDSLIERAQRAEQSGAWDAALDSYRQAVARMHTNELARREPHVLRRIGRIYFERGDHDEAHAAFETSLVKANALSLRQDAAAALNGLAAVEQFRGHLDVAEALYGRACVLADEVGDAALAGMIEQNLGTLASMRGDLGTALTHYQAALARLRSLGDKRASAWVLNNMGKLHVNVGEWAHAELCFNAACSLTERVGDDATRAKVESNRAELYLKRQHYERARECCEHAFRLFSRLGSDSGLGEVHKLFGVLYRETGKTHLALSRITTALRLARRCGNTLQEAEIENERARLFVELRRIPEAIWSLQRAHRLFCDLDARREILDLRKRLDELEQTRRNAIRIWIEELPETSRQNRVRGKRVAELAGLLARAVGLEDLNDLRVAAALCDVGNRALPPAVLDKSGPLSTEEWEMVRQHTLLGEALVEELQFPAAIRALVRSHHEHWDGSGYPDGLRGTEIPLAARILCIADVYDALTAQRSYRAAFTPAQALEIMEKQAGTIFDPDLLRTFASLIRHYNTASISLRDSSQEP